jgi:large subunit ribosomal protein L35Ae
LTAASLFRNLRKQRPQTSLIKIEGVQTRLDAAQYLGKRVAYIYKALKTKPRTAKRNFEGPLGGATKYRVIWGRIARTHGNGGTVRARFRTNIPPKAFGAHVRVMLYPSRV